MWKGFNGKICITVEIVVSTGILLELIFLRMAVFNGAPTRGNPRKLNFDPTLIIDYVYDIS